MFKENINNIPVVVLSAHTMGLGVIRSLGKMGVTVYSVFYEKKDMGIVSKFVKAKYYSPPPETDEKKFLDKLIEVSNITGEAVLFPADDATLFVVSKNKALLSQYFIVGCEEFESIKKIVNKKYTYKIAEELNIPHPKTSNSNLLNKEKIDELNFPVLIKPEKSHLYLQQMDRKMTLVHNADELHDAIVEANNNGLGVMIQEYIPGEDTSGFNYNCIIENGEIISGFTAQKIRYSPNGFGVPCAIKSIKEIDVLKTYSEKLLNGLKYNGYACLEFKYDHRDAQYKLMEVNGRFNRSIILSTRCGLNYPFIVYKKLTEGKYILNNNYKENIFWIDSTRDILMVIKYGLGGKNIIELLKPYLNENVFAVEDITDIKPALKRFLDLIKMAASKIRFKTLKEEKRAYYEERRYTT